MVFFKNEGYHIQGRYAQTPCLLSLHHTGLGRFPYLCLHCVSRALSWPLPDRLLIPISASLLTTAVNSDTDSEFPRCKKLD